MMGSLLISARTSEFTGTRGGRGLGEGKGLLERGLPQAKMSTAEANSACFIATMLLGYYPPRRFSVRSQRFTRAPLARVGLCKQMVDSGEAAVEAMCAWLDRWIPRRQPN